MTARERHWHATNDHIRDLMETVEADLDDAGVQRRWRLAMSEFARRAAECVGLSVAITALDLLDGVVDGVGDRNALHLATCQVEDTEATTAPETDALCAALTALRSPDAGNARLFDVMYWQSAEGAFPDPAAEEVVQAAIFKDIFGNPFRPVRFDPRWLSESAVALARTAYDTRNFSLLPVLADALEDAGCDSAEVLNHCRDPQQVHVRGCWVVDGVLGRA